MVTNGEDIEALHFPVPMHKPPNFSTCAILEQGCISSLAIATAEKVSKDVKEH